MQEQVQPPIVDTPENWDAASPGYAKHVAPRMMEAYANELIARLDVNEDTEALEVACGSGALTQALAKNVKSLLSIDFSPKMVDFLRNRMEDAGMFNIKVEVMDGMALDLPDNSFDRAACCFGLMLFPDRHAGFAELARVLRPGGKAVASAWTGPETFQSFGIFMQAIKRAIPDFPPPPSPPPIFSLSDPADFKAQMEAAGFQDVKVDLVTKELTVPDFDSMWAMITSGAPPVKMLFDKIGPEAQGQVQQALKEIVNERFSHGPITLSNTATVGYGIKA